MYILIMLAAFNNGMSMETRSSPIPAEACIRLYEGLLNVPGVANPDNGKLVYIKCVPAGEKA